MKIRKTPLVPIFVLAVISGAASAADCDCQIVVGNCAGAIEFIKSYGSSKSFGAEIIVHSSEASCSKVEYFVDSTPYQTILVNRKEESESLFGTSPISEKNVRYSACHVCKGGQSASGRSGQTYKTCSPGGSSDRTRIANGSIYTGAIGCDSYYVFAIGNARASVSELRNATIDKSSSICETTAFIVESNEFSERDLFSKERYYSIIHCKGKDSAAHLQFAPISQYSRSYDKDSDVFQISAPPSAVTTKN